MHLIVLNRHHWYSPRGARRGLALAAIAVACWSSWAVGHLSAPGARLQISLSCPVPRDSGESTVGEAEVRS